MLLFGRMGIIHIDECDKLARRGTGSDSGGYGTRDVGGEGVQQGKAERECLFLRLER